MNSTGRKVNKSLDIETKAKIIGEVDAGKKSKKDVAAEYEIPPSTLSTILKNRDTILSLFHAGSTTRKRAREADFPEVEKACVKWYKQCDDNGVQVTASLVREVAEQCAKSLGHNEFKASSGWLEKFKKRHGIVFRKSRCEKATGISVIEDQKPLLVAENWESKLATLTFGYASENVFCANELGLHYRCLPDEALALKDCHGDRSDNERLTALLVANATGTEKLKPYVIGSSATPRCFRGTTNLPVDYASNGQALMTADLFSEWLLNLDNQLQMQNRRILLFVDECRAHSFLPIFSHVDVHRLPNSVFDQAIAKNFKSNYRAEVVKKTLFDVGINKKPNINLLHAVRMIDKSWRNVNQNTIFNCFKKTGFPVDFNILPQAVINSYITHLQWMSVNAVLKVSEPMTFEEYVNIDENITVTGPSSICDSWEEERCSYSCDDDFLDECVTTEDAKISLNKLRTFFEKSDDLVGRIDDIFTGLNLLDNEIDRHILSNVKQRKITDYFTKK